MNNEINSSLYVILLFFYVSILRKIKKEKINIPLKERLIIKRHLALFKKLDRIIERSEIVQIKKESQSIVYDMTNHYKLVQDYHPDFLIAAKLFEDYYENIENQKTRENIIKNIIYETEILKTRLSKISRNAKGYVQDMNSELARRKLGRYFSDEEIETYDSYKYDIIEKQVILEKRF